MGRIAVLIPVYNQLDDLIRTLDSVDPQAADLEVFVVDDGSEPPIEIPAGRYSHPVHLINLGRNQGCAFARNVGLEKIIASGFDYVALQDAGDTDLDDRMAKQCQFLDENPDVAVVGAWAQYVNRDGDPLYVHQPPTDNQGIRERMPFSSAFTHPACMIRVAALRTVGLYDTTYPNSSDYEMLFRLTKSFESANLPEVLINKENNPDSLSLGKRRRGLRCRLRAQLAYFDLLSVRSYLGVLATLAFLVVPYRLIVALKQRRGFAG